MPLPPRLSGTAGLVLLALTSSLASQTLRLVKDIAPGTASSAPFAITEMVDRTLFFANSRELWQTDGTTAGTNRLLTLPAGGTIGHARRIGDRLVFLRIQPGVDTEVWHTDGTTGGTGKVADLRTARRAKHALVAGDRVFYLADATDGHTKLWSTDGTAPGTRPVGAFTRVGDIAEFGDFVMFVGRTAAHGDELWRSDGTTAGTYLVRETEPGPSGSVFQVKRVGDAGFFSIRRHPAQFERESVWRTDGTGAGTYPLPGFPTAREVHLQGGFAHRLVVTGDGSSPNTRTIYEVDPSTGSIIKQLNRPYYWPWMMPFRDGALFVAGLDLAFMRSDADLPVYVRSGFGMAPPLVTGSRFAVLRTSGSRSVPSLWITDGTARGTKPLNPLTPGILDAALCNGTIYVSAQTARTGFELWAIDLGATSASIGTGLGTGARIPRLEVSDPVIGSASTVTLSHARPGTSILFIGAGWGRPRSMGPGATLYVDLGRSLTLPMTVAQSSASLRIGIPNQPSLLGAKMAFQVMTPGAPVPRGFEWTNGVLTRIGR